MKFWRIVCALVIALAIPIAAYSAGDAPEEPVTVRTTPPSPYDEGRNQANMGNWANAAKWFQKAVDKSPKDHKAWNMLGYALRKEGNFKKAIEAYNRALSIKPDYTQALEYRGKAFLKVGNKEAAVADYQKLVKLGSPLAEDLKEAIDQPPAN